TATAASTASSAEDPNKKIRKPYTITKSRESWTEPEHDKFLEALQLFDRDWKKIEAFVGSKTVIQIRSHAQKYFLKVQKNGTSEHLPPPRPKRKAAHPYPQKASKNAQPHQQVSGSFQSSAALLDTGYVLRSDPSSMLMNPNTSAAASSWTNNAQTVSFSQAKKGSGLANNSCSSTESTPKTRQIGEMTDQGNHGHALRVLPDFAQVYSFIGSIFDPNVTGHLQKLKKMDPIDVETVWFILHITFYTILPDIATDMIAYLSFSYSGTAVDEKPLHQSDKS
ncbi:Homeodomain-like superfamily protein isoform 8, partial [Theobroma cacao]